MTENEFLLRKPNAALVMVPKAGKLTSLERKLFNSILMSSISQLKEHRATHGHDLDGNHLYSAPADELLDPLELGKSNHRSILRQHMLSLRRAEVEWEAPDAKAGVIWSNSTVLPRAEMELRGGRLFARWKLSDEICEAISNTGEFPFTRLDLAQIAKLTSYTAVALYEICARYRNNFLKGGDGECLTSASDPDWWIDALTNTTPKIDKKTGLVQRREWRKIKNEVITKAIDEINTKTDVTVELIEKRDGKPVALVQFSVRTKRGVAKKIPASQYEVIKLGVRLGLSQPKIEAAFNTNTTAEITLALAKFEARINNKGLMPLTTPTAYFSAVLKSMKPIDVVADPDIQTPASVSVATPKIDRQTEEFAAQHDALRNEFAALSDQIQNEYATKALAKLSEKKQTTPRMIDSAAGGVWMPRLLAEMQMIFAKEKAAADGAEHGIEAT